VRASSRAARASSQPSRTSASWFSWVTAPSRRPARRCPPTPGCVVHPCYYKGQEEKQSYNVLHPWQYERLAEVFSSAETPMQGFAVRTQGELERVLKIVAEKDRKGPILVRVILPRSSFPKAIGYSLAKCK
jgi:hypothetical protein